VKVSEGDACPNRRPANPVSWQLLSRQTKLHYMMQV
jgi:hypothetical protein